MVELYCSRPLPKQPAGISILEMMGVFWPKQSSSSSHAVMGVGVAFLVCMSLSWWPSLGRAHPTAAMLACATIACAGNTVCAGAQRNAGYLRRSGCHSALSDRTQAYCWVG